MDARHAKYQYLKAWTLIKKNPHSEKTRLLTVLSPVQFSSVRTILPLQKAGYPDLSEADDCYSEAALLKQYLKSCYNLTAGNPYPLLSDTGRTGKAARRRKHDFKQMLKDFQKKQCRLKSRQHRKKTLAPVKTAAGRQYQKLKSERKR